MSGLLALLTDFGTRDAYVGCLKGVILGLAPATRLVDVTHEIPAGDVRRAALLLGDAWPCFPPGTVFLAVVDPGVGTERRPMALRSGDRYFVGPDNGLVTAVLQAAPEFSAVCLDRPEFWLPAVSGTFHGRDIFAPVAVRLATGAKLEELGSRLTNPVLSNLPAPIREHQSILGQVLYADRFGNLVTNITARELPAADGGRVSAIWVGEARIGKIAKTYGELAAGELGLLLNSAGRWEIALRDASAARELDIVGEESGTPVSVQLR